MAGSGGMERVVSQKINYLSELENYELTIITAEQHERPYYFYLSPKIKKVDLNIEFHNERNRFALKKEFKEKLSDFLCHNQMDICISTGGQELYFLPTIKDGSKKIVEFHFAFDINEQWIRTVHSGLFWHLFGKLKTFRMVCAAKYFDKIVVLTKTDLSIWSKLCRHVVQIYNPITIKISRFSTCEHKIVIAVGRLDPQKGFDYLIDSWGKIAGKYPDWQLNIFGEGPERHNLEIQIEKSNLGSHVFLRGATSNILDEYINSSIFVLSSRYEGFPLVIEEAMSCGLPIVSFDCPSGPSELVKDGLNGFLIPIVGDVKNMASHIEKLIRDVELRKEMGRKSLVFSLQLSEQAIMNKWIQVFTSMMLSKHQ
jgi:glycosyltransferase involved in cell wall biosynthesis